MSIERAARELLNAADHAPTHEKTMTTIDQLADMIDARLTTAKRASAFEYVEYYTRRENAA